MVLVSWKHLTRAGIATDYEKLKSDSNTGATHECEPAMDGPGALPLGAHLPKRPCFLKGVGSNWTPRVKLPYIRQSLHLDAAGVRGVRSILKSERLSS